MKVRLLVLTAGMVALEIAAQAEIKLPSAIADKMVLQRESNVKLWGKATPGAQVRVMPSWAKSVSTAVAASDSTWLVKVETPQAGGPHSIEFAEGKEKQTVGNVLIGEVWFCSGQSNMEMPMKGFVSQPVDGASATVSEAKKSTPIRMFITDSDRGRRIRQHSKTQRFNIQKLHACHRAETVRSKC